MRRIFQGPLVYLLLIAIIILTVNMLGSSSPVESRTLSYTELLEWVEADLRSDLGETVSEAQQGMTLDQVIIQQNVLIGRIEDSLVSEQDFGTYYDIRCILPSEEQFYTDVNAIYTEVLGRSVSPTEYRFEITTRLPASPSWWVEWLPILVTVALFGVLMYFMFRQQSGGAKGAMNFGKSRARLSDPNANKVTFQDVAGADEEKEELKEIVQFLKDPKKFTKLGAKIPTGVLLVGPPGTGKTLLARAVAGEANVPFFTISGSDFVEMFVGVGASRVRDLFDQAKKAAPSFIFIDEIDAVGRRRGSGMGGGHDEREQTLNQLLVEMDGFDNDTNLIIIAATNRPDVLDPALLRPGRFDRQVAVEAPDLEGREAILKVHAKGKPFVPDVDLHAIAVRTPGFTGADLANVLNEAALLCARAGAQLIDNRAIDEAIDRVMSGPKRKSKGMALDELRNTAYHEGGHALVAAALHHTDPVTKITILPRGRALGYTAVMPTEDRYSQSRNQLLDQMAYAMGGRTAEEIVFHDPTTGASNDIEKATAIARKMVVEYGFSSQLGAIKWADDDDQTTVMDGLQPRKYSDRTAEIIDQEVLKLVETAHTEAWTILNENRDILDELVRQLLVKQTLNEKEVAAIFANIRKAPEREVWLSNDQRPDSDLPPVPIPESLKRSVGMGAGE